MDPKLEDLTTFQTRYGIYKYKVLPFRLTNVRKKFTSIFTAFGSISRPNAHFALNAHFTLNAHFVLNAHFILIAHIILNAQLIYNALLAHFVYLTHFKQ